MASVARRRKEIGRAASLARSPDWLNGQDQEACVQERLQELQALDLLALRDEWRRLRGVGPPRLSRDLMLRSVAYALQVEAFGGLPAAVLRKLEASNEVIGEAPQGSEPLRTELSVGARLVREWHGRTYSVEVLHEGFLFEGKAYSSLSEIARRITGAHWSGPRFFGLVKRGR